MDWALENWFWILILVIFIATHLFGHGGHGGHGGHRSSSKKEKLPQGDTANTSKHSGQHQH